ncbi:MAG: hypothetical protein ACR2FY_00375 [Pirellulaceae bacterium]
MSRIIPLIAAVLIAVRPFSGCCECHAPLVSAIVSAWDDAWSDEHEDDCCPHSVPCPVPGHPDGKCPSCESTKDFVKVAAPQVAKASLVWYFAPSVAADSKLNLPASACRCSPGPLFSPGLRAHLVLGVMLI